MNFPKIKFLKCKFKYDVSDHVVFLIRVVLPAMLILGDLVAYLFIHCSIVYHFALGSRVLINNVKLDLVLTLLA